MLEKFLNILCIVTMPEFGQTLCLKKMFILSKKEKLLNLVYLLSGMVTFVIAKKYSDRFYIKR